MRLPCKRSRPSPLRSGPARLSCGADAGEQRAGGIRRAPLCSGGLRAAALCGAKPSASAPTKLQVQCAIAPSTLAPDEPPLLPRLSLRQECEQESSGLAVAPMIGEGPRCRHGAQLRARKKGSGSGTAWLCLMRL